VAGNGGWPHVRSGGAVSRLPSISAAVKLAGAALTSDHLEASESDWATFVPV